MCSISPPLPPFKRHLRAGNTLTMEATEAELEVESESEESYDLVKIHLTEAEASLSFLN